MAKLGFIVTVFTLLKGSC